MNLFGTGLLWGTPLTDNTGANIAAPTPYLFGTLQDVELDIKFELKKLHGQNAFPVAVGRGKGTISGKAKFASIYAGMFEAFVGGQGMVNGQIAAVYDTTGAVIPATPFEITVSPPGGGAFDADLGVINATNGRPMMRVNSGPATTQYAVDPVTGKYTFASADAGKTMYINYRYTRTVVGSSNRRGTVTNQPMGYTPSFRTDLFVPYAGNSLVLTMAKCASDGLKLSFKNDDFSIPEFGFDAFADNSGKVFDWSFSE